MSGMVRESRVLLEVNECSGELDECLVKATIGVVAAKPEVFEDIVRFVKLTMIEAVKECAIFSWDRRLGIRIPSL